MIRALILDDERFLRLGMSKIIRENVPGMEVSGMFGDGMACLEYLENNDADVIISDIRMPHMDGLDLLKIVRERKLPVDFFLISGYDDFEYCRTAIRYNVCDYIRKPIDKDDFIEVMRAYTRRKGETEARDGAPTKEPHGVARAMKQYIRSHFAEKLSMEQLASAFSLNANYISQMFKKETGVSVTEYLYQIRMEMASVYLRDLDNRIADVADKVGYTDQKQFSVAFKKAFGKTPSEYRNEL